ncbi:MAG: fibronectin type III domain-containing protein [Paludibacteraceae bacterium]|nr:fibronectin type III domain-containing protein [Paludibacteraceae bacterium]
MKKLVYIIAFIVIGVLSGPRLAAQAVPFACSFEEDEDLSQWVMNYNTPLATDKWMIGTAVHSEGQRSMYISTNRRDPQYGCKPNVVATYLRFKFPEAPKQQNYDISFDWKGIGDPASSRLYVMVCPEVMLTNTANNNPYNLDRIISETSGLISTNVVNTACQQLGANGDRFLCGKEQWENVALTNEVKVSSNNSKVPFAIVFIWVNNNTDESIHQTSICIDNLQIGTAQIKKPQKVQVEAHCEDSTLLVSWESGLSEFEVQYRKIGTDTWRRQDGITDDVDGFTRDGLQCSYRLQRISEGTYDVRVLGKAGDIQSNYSYKNQTLVYCPDNHCVNYIDLYNPNLVCTYGSIRPNETPYDHIGVIDYGPDAAESRHTIHVDPTETDPRTEDCLRTVPKGALASVRLGNWKTSYEAESMTYSFVVDSANQGVLIIRYAVVLNKPNESCGDPGFKMVVLDEQGNEIDETCGKAEYTYTSAVAADWNETKDGSVVWKDWTTVGVNLQPYNGQTVRVRLTTEDCGGGGHFGYAYFTLDCASAHLETENCGNDSKIECFAPEGFAYEWYNEAGVVVGTDRELVVDPGRQTYTCRVSFIEDPECYFEVSTLSAPRFPVPEYTIEPIYDQCLSKLRFHNTSHIMNMYEGYENHTHEATEECHWSFTRLSDGLTTESYNWNPVYTCPSEGDTIVVTLTTYIGINNACDSVRTDTIVAVNILPEHSVFNMTTCPEMPINFGGEWFNEDTTYIGVYPNFAGCDSTSTLYLKVWPEIPDTYRHDSICSDSSIVVNGLRYNTPFENKLIVMKSEHGCDSALYLTLTVNQRIRTDVDELPYQCADGNVFYLTYDVHEGQYDSLCIHFSTPELRDTTIYNPSETSVAIPYPATILPGHYTATLEFYQFCCGIYRIERAVDIRYRSSIVEQKWNDVLAVTNSKYNGGYTFTRYQWYKDNVQIPGETGSYLYQPLDPNSTYYVELTRPDGVMIATCPIQPEARSVADGYPTIVKIGQRIAARAEKKMTVRFYTMTGTVYSTYTFSEGDISLPVPETSGIYVVKTTYEDGASRTQYMIVGQ